MTVVEFRPSAAPDQWKQPDHLSDKPSFKSKRLGRVVSTLGVPYLSDEDLEDLYTELTQEIQTLASRMGSQLWPRADWCRMRAKKSRWGAVHQAVQKRRGAKARAEKRRNHLARPLPDVFCDVAREELPDELYKRLMDTAKQRVAENSAELASMDSAAT